ncbi:hypothetical protein QAD02_010773 [Eretmocerus hayati]|uniref:Uncharacterized protein n=1 Tax=Eretmocerus hayati TaxID=131215 RepID=A0ACC2NV79_9HYME|nr:hypothetical protein QAD02_010773 [Eretmocerus hayati]
MFSGNKGTTEDLPILQNSYVHMKDKQVVLQKINKIIRDGAEKLQIVTDFDLTLTKQHECGAPILGSFGIFKKSNQIPSHYLEESKKFGTKYRAIQIDPHIPIEEKIVAMDEWYEAANMATRNFMLNRDEIEKLVDLYGQPLRDRTKELFSKLGNLKVPILVFSAGIGDIVEAVLKCRGILQKNVNVISNFLKWNGDVLDGFKNSDRMIHVFNKSKHSVANEYFKILRGRSNVVLMGDTIEDSQMADGVEETETVLRIGFLYERVEESLPSFKDAFDIVLVDDQTMDVVLAILGPIL